MDITKILRPVLILSKIFTMSTVTFKPKPNNQIEYIKPNRKLIYYFRLTVLLLLVCFCVIFRQIRKSIYNSTGVITMSVQFAHYNCRIPIAILCLVVTNYNSNYVVDFLNSFTEVDKIFKKTKQIVEHENILRHSYIILIVTVVKLFVQHLPYLVSGLYWDEIDFMDYIIYNIPLILIHILTFKWMVKLNILRCYFKSLNKLLKSLKYTNCWVVNDYYKVYKEGNSKKHLPTTEIIRQSGLIYDILCLQGDRINRAYAWQILFIVPAKFILIIYSSFNVCQMIKDKVEFDEKAVIFDILHFMSFLELVMPSVFVKEEADKFVDILHRIDVNFERNTELDDVMNTVTLQTYHQKIEFSAFGVFPLDGTLIYSIFGALTTYLVILLQFDV